MKAVIISPYSQKLRSGRRNPKNYPRWDEVIASLKQRDFKVIQIGVTGEERIGGVDEHHIGLSLRQIETMVKETDTWASVDNFFPHLCNLMEKPGVVVFGRSDPLIFGYPQNINLLRDRGHLRAMQYDIWDTVEYSDTIFVSPQEVVDSILKIAKKE